MKASVYSCVGPLVSLLRVSPVSSVRVVDICIEGNPFFHYFLSRLKRVCILSHTSDPTSGLVEVSDYLSLPKSLSALVPQVSESVPCNLPGEVPLLCFFVGGVKCH